MKKFFVVIALMYLSLFAFSSLKLDIGARIEAWDALNMGLTSEGVGAASIIARLKGMFLDGLSMYIGLGGAASYERSMGIDTDFGFGYYAGDIFGIDLYGGGTTFLMKNSTESTTPDHYYRVGATLSKPFKTFGNIGLRLSFGAVTDQPVFYVYGWNDWRVLPWQYWKPFVAFGVEKDFQVLGPTEEEESLLDVGKKIKKYFPEYVNDLVKSSINGMNDEVILETDKDVISLRDLSDGFDLYKQAGKLVYKGVEFKGDKLLVFKKPVGIVFLKDISGTDFTARWWLVNVKMLSENIEGKVVEALKKCSYKAGENTNKGCSFRIDLLDLGDEYTYKYNEEIKGNTSPEKVFVEREGKTAINVSYRILRYRLGKVNKNSKEDVYVTFVKNTDNNTWNVEIDGGYYGDLIGKGQYDLELVGYDAVVEVSYNDSESNVLKEEVVAGSVGKANIGNISIESGKESTIKSTIKGLVLLPSDDLKPVGELISIAGAEIKKKELEVEDKYGNKAVMNIKTKIDSERAGSFEKSLKLEFNGEVYELPRVKVTILPDLKSMAFYKYGRKWHGMEQVEEANTTMVFEGVVLKDQFGNVIPDTYISKLELVSKKCDAGNIKLVYRNGKLIVQNLIKAGNFACDFEGSVVLDPDVIKEYESAGLKVSELKSLRLKEKDVTFAIAPRFSGVTKNIALVDTKATRVYEKKIEPIMIKDEYGNSFVIASLSGELGGYTMGARISIMDKSQMSIRGITKVADNEVASINIKNVEVELPTGVNGLDMFKVNELARNMKLSVVLNVSPADPYKAILLRKNTEIDKITLPTYTPEDVVNVPMDIVLYDEFGNKFSTIKDGLITVKAEGVKFDLLKTAGYIKGIVVSNEGNKEIAEKHIVMLSGSRQLGDVTVKFVPVAKRIVDIDLKSVMFNIASLKVGVDDGNGHPVKGAKVDVIVDKVLERSGETDDRGMVDLMMKLGSFGEHDILVKVTPLLVKEIADIYKPKPIIMEVRKELISSVDIEKITLEEDLSELRIGQKALMPVVSPSGKYVAYPVISVSSGEYEVKFIVQDIESKEKKDIFARKIKKRGRTKEKDVERSAIYSYVWHPVKDILIYTPFDKNSFNIYAYDPNSGKKYAIYTSDNNDINVSFNSVGNKMVWSSGGAIMIADVDYKGERVEISGIRTLIGTDKGVNLMSVISPNGKYVAFIRDGDLYLYDITSGKEEKLTSSHTRSKRDISWSQDSKRFAYYVMKEGKQEYELAVYDLENKKSWIAYENANPEYGPVLWYTPYKFIFAATDKPVEQPLLSYDVNSKKCTEVMVDSENRAILFKNINLFADVDKKMIYAVYRAFGGKDSIYFGVVYTR